MVAKKKLKFDSFFGFAISEAKKKGDLVRIAFQFNVKDDFPPESKLIMTQHILDDVVYPEIMNRVKEGSLEPNFRLQHAHLLLYSDPSRNEILLNKDCRMIAKMKAVKGKVFENNQPVKEKDVEEIIGIYPNYNNDPNAAHIMLSKFKGKWYFAANLIYDRIKVQSLFNTSQKFLKSVCTSLEEENWSPFVDNLFSVTELSIQSILRLRHYNGYSRKQSHTKTRELLKGYCETGNAPMTFLENYDKLWALRKKARYLQGTGGKEFTIEKEKARQMLSVTEEMISYTKSLLQVINNYSMTH